MSFYLQGYETVIQRREREKRERAAVEAERMAEGAARAAGVEVYRTYLQKKAEKERLAKQAAAMGAGATGKKDPWAGAKAAGAAKDNPFAGATAEGKTGTTKGKSKGKSNPYAGATAKGKSGSGTGSRSPSTGSHSESDGQVDYFREATGVPDSGGVFAQTATPTKTNNAAMWVVGIGIVGGAVLYGMRGKSKSKGRKY